MPVSSPVNAARLRIGDRVRFSGTVRIVIGLSGTVVRLADPGGTLTEVTLAELVNAGDFERVGVPLSLQASHEFQGACPASATVMRAWLVAR